MHFVVLASLAEASQSKESIMRKFLIASAAAVMAAGIAATPADAQYYGGYSPYG